MSRKTVKIESIINTVNVYLKDSTCTAEERKGMKIVLEGLLFETDNYRGYRFLEAHEVPMGHLPGIRKQHEDVHARFADTDDTRVAYYG
jgi:hypothetical protein